MNTNNVESNVPASDEQTPAEEVRVGLSQVSQNILAAPQVLAEKAAPMDLVGMISVLMSNAGHPRPEAWKRLLDPKAYDLAYEDDYRRFLINRVLRMALADAPGVTLDIRYCLVDTGDYDRWLELIASEVVPCMVTNDLPRTLS